jgi:nitric oxide reductase NorD protein
MVGVNRPSDEDSAEGARQALADMDELTLGQSRQSVGAGLKLALDLAPSQAATAALAGPLALPEWDHRRRRYLERHCLVQAEAASMEGPHWRPDAAARRRIRQVRRRFEALRPRREIRPRQLDGSELDMDALVRAAADRRASGRLSDRIYLATHDQARDLAVALLVDASLSTDAWVDDCRVLDVAKEAVTALALGLEACGDPLAIWSFTSNRRVAVRLARLKGFDEPLAGLALARIAALEPGYYTRMGAALRYARQQLEPRPERHRLILLLSDGKPHDIDHYDGRHGIEDTRMAVREARRVGMAVFAIAIDRAASAHLPYLFGRGGYALVSRIGRLVPALPQIYRQLVG